MSFVILAIAVAVAFLYGVYTGEKCESMFREMEMKDINNRLYHARDQVKWWRPEAD